MPGCAGWTDPVLWSRLSETPFDDVRLRIVDALTLRAEQPKLGTDRMELLWVTVLLGVHRGGRQKLKALKQVRDAIATDMQLTNQLLPVLASAVRSIRGPEARAALSSVVTLIAIRPELEPAVASALPELTLSPLAAA